MQPAKLTNHTPRVLNERNNEEYYVHQSTSLNFLTTSEHLSSIVDPGMHFGVATGVEDTSTLPYYFWNFLTSNVVIHRRFSIAL